MTSWLESWEKSFHSDFDSHVLITGFEISLVWSSETSKNDDQTSGILAGLFRRTTAYFWFSHKSHWLCIFQTSELYIQTSDFYNPLAWWTSAFNLKFLSLYQVTSHNRLAIVACALMKADLIIVFQVRATLNFIWFGSRAHKHFVKWVSRNISCHEIYGQFSSAKSLHILQPCSPTIHIT